MDTPHAGLSLDHFAVISPQSTRPSNISWPWLSSTSFNSLSYINSVMAMWESHLTPHIPPPRLTIRRCVHLRQLPNHGQQTPSFLFPPNLPNSHQWRHSTIAPPVHWQNAQRHSPSEPQSCRIYSPTRTNLKSTAPQRTNNTSFRISNNTESSST